MLEYLSNLSLWKVLLLILAENAAIALGVVLLGNKLRKMQAVSFSATDVKAAAGTVFLNAGLTCTGYWLWRQEWIAFQETFNYRVLTDGLILLFAMDLSMFLFHYGIHKTRFFYNKIHQVHHQHHEPAPIDLFVLHPLEVVGFGGVWLLLISIHPFNIYAVSWYLIFNRLESA